MANDLWTTVEEAVLTALQTELDGQINTLVSYQGEWLSDLARDYWKFPAVLVQLRRSLGEQITLGSYDLTLEFTIFVVTRGGSVKHRAANGAYRILSGVREALWHQDLGLDLQPLKLIKEEPLLNNQDFSVYAAHYGTAMVRDLGS
jgi:phage gp37-like protein